MICFSIQSLPTPRRLRLVLLVALLLVSVSRSRAAAPEVSNIQVQQEAGSYLVNITYDLNDPDADLMFISCVVSLDDGNTWTVLCRSVSGDVGPMVHSGTGKAIVWDASEDIPDFEGDHCRVRILATDVDPHPVMNYFRVVGDDTLAMSKSEPDTIGYGQPLDLLWRGETPVLDGLVGPVVAEMDTVWPYGDGLLGYKWRLMEEICNPGIMDCWHPRVFDEATGDSLSYFATNNELLFRNNGSGPEPWKRLLASGEFRMRFNTIDITGTEIDQAVNQEFSFVVNFDPETILLKGEADWAHPEDPEIYPYYTLLNDPDQIHYPFGEDERIPDRSYVVFKALFRDDPRDQKADPTYRMGVTGHALGRMSLNTGGVLSFNTGYSSVDTDPAWDAGLNGFYADTLGFMPSPNTEFDFSMAGVDEHGRWDGTASRMSFQVGFPPCVQCLEILPNVADPSSYPPDLACYDPEMGDHPCFADTVVFYIKKISEPWLPGRVYLQAPSPGYMGIHKVSGQVEYGESEFDPEEYFSFLTQVYHMGLFLHGRDDWREAWPDPRSRVLAWRYQVDYACDPYNSIADGGGTDDLSSPTWGATDYGQPGLEIDPIDGLWKLGVDIVVPDLLVQLGPATFYDAILHAMADGDAELADELFNKCIRQLSSGTVQAIALDQTRCGFFPTRPAMYHVFSDVRPPAGGTQGGTWRDCLPQFNGIAFNLNLYPAAMGSLDNEPVEKSFRIIFQGSDGDFGCQAEVYKGRLALPPWNVEE